MSTDSENLYKEIRDIYINNLNFSKSLVDYLTNEEIILLCLEGRSVSFIANRFQMNTGEIESILSQYLGFSGWTFDLDFSPHSIYNASDKNFEEYLFNVTLISPQVTEETLLGTYFICKVFDALKERMDDEYYRT